jgi:hypothetical protein
MCWKLYPQSNSAERVDPNERYLGHEGTTLRGLMSILRRPEAASLISFTFCHGVIQQEGQPDAPGTLV